jgi:hypothetical protein
MTHPTTSKTGFLIVAIVALSILVSAGPTLIALVQAAVPLVIAVGVVAVILRLVFFHTRQW